MTRTLAALAIVAALGASAALAGTAQRDLAPDAAALPSVVPLFPLPDVVLFPRVSRPLYIFEPRYREMVADALKGNRIIGMVLLRPGFEKDYEGRPPIYDIGTAGRIEQYEELPDGRYAIMLRGFTKFRVLSEDQSRAYRLARVEVMPEILRDADLAPLSTLRQRVETLYLMRIPPDASGPDPSLSDESYVNIIAQYLNIPEPLRQELLERGSVLDRARALVALLEGR
jgi:Lon protease-like protein